MACGEQFCTELRSVVGADLASLNGLNPDLSFAWAVDSPAGTCHGEVAQAVARLAASHPLVCWGSCHPGSPLRLADLHPWSSFRHTELYADIYRPLGLRHELQVIVAGRQGFVAVAMQRTGSEFEDGTMDRLSLLSSVFKCAASMMWSAVEGDSRACAAGSESTDACLLTAREREVLGLLADGARDADVARICGISAATAKKHVEHILHKLDVGTRAGAVAAGFRRDLLSP